MTLVEAQAGQQRPLRTQEAAASAQKLDVVCVSLPPVAFSKPPNCFCKAVVLILRPQAAARSCGRPRGAARRAAAIYSTAHELISLFSAISPTRTHARRERDNGWICPSAQSEEGRALECPIGYYKWMTTQLLSHLPTRDRRAQRLQPAVTGQQARKNASKHHRALTFFFVRPALFFLLLQV